MSRPFIGITADERDEYVQSKAPYCRAVEFAGGVPFLLPPVKDFETYGSLVDGLLIPGGGDVDPAYYGEKRRKATRPVDRRRTDFELSLLSFMVRADKPVLGICYGMQLLNVFFGGRLYQDIATECPVAINHKNNYHMIVVAENRFLTRGSFSVNSSHHQAVKSLGATLSPIAHSDDRIIEALCGEGRFFLVGVQWHPERMPKEKLSEDLFRRFIDAARSSKYRNE